MRLNIAERIGVMTILPQKGSYIELKTGRMIFEAVEIKPEEAEAVNGTWTADGFNYDTTKDFEAEIDLLPNEVGFIKQILDKMNADRTLQTFMVSLYEKFLGGTNGEQS